MAEAGCQYSMHLSGFWLAFGEYKHQKEYLIGHILFH